MEARVTLRVKYFMHFLLGVLIHRQRFKFCLNEKLKVVYLPKDSWIVYGAAFPLPKRKEWGASAIQSDKVQNT